MRLVGQTACSVVAAWLSLVAVGVVEGTSGSERIGHSVVYEDSSGFVGTVGSVEFQVSVGETGTFVGGTANFGIQGNLGFRIPHQFSAVRSFFLYQIYPFFDCILVVHSLDIHSID